MDPERRRWSMFEPPGPEPGCDWLLSPPRVTVMNVFPMRLPDPRSEVKQVKCVSVPVRTMNQTELKDTDADGQIEADAFKNR